MSTLQLQYPLLRSDFIFFVCLSVLIETVLSVIVLAVIRFCFIRFKLVVLYALLYLSASACVFLSYRQCPVCSTLRCLSCLALRRFPAAVCLGSTRVSLLNFDILSYLIVWTIMSRLYISASWHCSWIFLYYFILFSLFFFCNLQCTLFVTNPADWLPYQ